MKITKKEIHNIILIHTARTWERIRLKQRFEQMPQDNVRSAYEAIPEIAYEILKTDIITELISRKQNWDWGRKTKGYAYFSDEFIEKKATEIIYNNYLNIL